MSAPSTSGLRAYVALLSAAGAACLIAAASRTGDVGAHWLVWASLVGLLTVTELAGIFFHEENARFGLSAAEVVFLPMLIALPFGMTVIGAAIAIAIVRVWRWRQGAMRTVFNIAQYTCAAGAAAAVYAAAIDRGSNFTVGRAGAAVVAVVMFAGFTHVFSAAAVALASGRSFTRMSAHIAPATLMNLGLNVVLGLFLAAAYSAAPWTTALFPLPIVASFLGYGALLRQRHASERVEQLHAASRALATSPDLGGAIVRFLDAVREMCSATEARVTVPVQGRRLWWSVRSGVVVADGRPVESGPMYRLFEELRHTAEPIVVTTDEVGPPADLRAELETESFVAVPLIVNDKVLGCLTALGRVGADEFSDEDARLLSAVGDELLMTLDSYRLFDEVLEERERFRRIFEGSREGICLLDGEGVVRAWNSALERMTGYSEREVLDEVWSERVMVRDDAQKRVSALDVVELPSETQLELVAKDGSTRWVSFLAGAVGSGKDRSWVVLVRDVSSDHEAEQAKSDFLTTVSHELRTPLTTIKGSLEILARGVDKLPADTADQMIDVTRRGADRLERLVMNLLTVSQIETGAMHIYADEVALDRIVRDSATAILDGREQVRIVVPKEDVVVRADHEHLTQAIDHLLDNARKFGAPEGWITIEVRCERGFGYISVFDEGPGVPVADRERIFERFVRLGNILTREQGPGIGLFVAKCGVDAMGGSIWADGEPGAGAAFHIELPLARPMAVDATA